MKLKKAKDDIVAANLLMKPENNPTNDEGIYDLAAYHAQQAVFLSELFCADFL